MAIRIPTFQTVVDPTGLDRALASIATRLADISWMNYSFGLCHKILDENGNKPVLYLNDGLEHYPVYPNEDLGNFSVFDRYEGDVVNDFPGRRINEYRTKVGLIFWGDLREIYAADWRQRTREHVRADLMETLRNSSFRYAKIEPLEFYYEGRNIYPDYSISELDSQFLMRPFVGMRIDMFVTYNNETYC